MLFTRRKQSWSYAYWLGRMRLLIWLLLNLNSKRRLPSELGVVEIFWESLFLESVSEFLNLEMLA